MASTKKERDPYQELWDELEACYHQAESGKGKERHGNGKPYLNQPIMEIGRMVGLGYHLGQAMKKTQESLRILELKGNEAAISELQGAVNYIASAIIMLREDNYRKTKGGINNGA